jgi:hypothetical protein
VKRVTWLITQIGADDQNTVCLVLEEEAEEIESRRNRSRKAGTKEDRNERAKGELSCGVITERRVAAS